MLKMFYRTSEGLSLLGTASNAFFGVAIFFLLARSLSPGDLGAWVVFISGTVLFDMVRYGLVQNGLVKYYAGAAGMRMAAVEGGSLLIHLTVTFVLACILIMAGLLFPQPVSSSVFALFVRWYPLYALVSMPHAFAEWISQARDRFDRILVIRWAVRLPFLVYLILNYTLLHQGLISIVFMYTATNLTASLLVLMLRWMRLGAIRGANRATVKELLHFGKFSTATLAGANLLKSSDTFLIGHFLGSAAAAMYSVPLKILEIIELPIRGVGAAAFLSMSKHHNAGNIPALRKMLLRNVGRVNVVLLPFLALGFLFADQLVILFGGQQYGDTAVIIRILTVYCALIPLDRYTGIALDSIGKPLLNAMKVWLMLVINIVGDMVAIGLTHDIRGVALSSILTFSVGFAVNLVLIRRHFGVRISPRVLIRSLRRTLSERVRKGQTHSGGAQGPAKKVLLIRRVLFMFLYWLGLPLIARWIMRNRPRALAFHNIVSDPQHVNVNRYLHADPHVFERQMQHLARYYHPITTEEFLATMESLRKPHANEVLVTFDDGYRNMVSVAAPILQRYHVPCLVAVIGSVHGNDYVPWDVRISIALTKLHGEDTPAHSPQEFAELTTRFIRHGHQVRSEMLHHLAQQAKLSWTREEVARYDPELLGMTWEDARQLQQMAQVAFAAHTQHHAVLNFYGDTEIHTELVDSRRSLEEATGQKISIFVYPAGVVDARVKECVRKAGFRFAFGLSHKFLSPMEDPLNLGRIGVPPFASYEEFVCRVSGLLALPVATKKACIRLLDRARGAISSRRSPSPLPDFA